MTESINSASPEEESVEVVEEQEIASADEPIGEKAEETPAAEAVEAAVEEIDDDVAAIETREADTEDEDLLEEDEDLFEEDEDLFEEDEELEPNYIDGPADYVARERRGRGRRIGSDVQFEDINYKNITLLTRFLDRRGRVLSRRKTRVSAKVQRRVVKAIKRARHLALLPYTADQTRIVRKRR